MNQGRDFYQLPLPHSATSLHPSTLPSVNSKSHYKLTSRDASQSYGHSEIDSRYDTSRSKALDHTSMRDEYVRQHSIEEIPVHYNSNYSRYGTEIDVLPSFSHFPIGHSQELVFSSRSPHSIYIDPIATYPAYYSLVVPTIKKTSPNFLYAMRRSAQDADTAQRLAIAGENYNASSSTVAFERTHQVSDERYRIQRNSFPAQPLSINCSVSKNSFVEDSQGSKNSEHSLHIGDTPPDHSRWLNACETQLKALKIKPRPNIYDLETRKFDFPDENSGADYAPHSGNFSVANFSRSPDSSSDVQHDEFLQRQHYSNQTLQYTDSLQTTLKSSCGPLSSQSDGKRLRDFFHNTIEKDGNTKFLKRGSPRTQSKDQWRAAYAGKVGKSYSMGQEQKLSNSKKAQRKLDQLYTRIQHLQNSNQNLRTSNSRMYCFIKVHNLPMGKLLEQNANLRNALLELQSVRNNGSVVADEKLIFCIERFDSLLSQSVPKNNFYSCGQFH